MIPRLTFFNFNSPKFLFKYLFEKKNEYIKIIVLKKELI